MREGAGLRNKVRDRGSQKGVSTAPRRQHPQKRHDSPHPPSATPVLPGAGWTGGLSHGSSERPAIADSLLQQRYLEVSRTLTRGPWGLSSLLPWRALRLRQVCNLVNESTWERKVHRRNIGIINAIHTDIFAEKRKNTSVWGALFTPPAPPPAS